MKGKENEQQAYQAFCRLMADHEGEPPAPTVISVAEHCDFLLDHAQRHNKASTFQNYRSYLQDFCKIHGRRMPVDTRSFHVSRWLDSRESW